MRRSLILLVAVAAGACAPPTAPPAPANILLITVDTMRADRLGRGFTPALDLLGSQGLRFTAARSVVPLTLPAHVSIMTGLLPPAHGIRGNGAARLGGTATLAAQLKAAGYQTHAIVGAFVLDRRFGLESGFDSYDDQILRDPQAMDTLQAERPAGEVIGRALSVLGQTSAAAPWLLWVHVYDPHAPYAPPSADLARAGGVGYDGEVAYVDGEIAKLLAAIERRPDAARTAVIVIGDHGESLGEHGEATHGMLVFESTLRVPLIIRAPGVVPAERRDAASLIDVAPTVLALAGRPAAQLPGRNLAGPPVADTETYAESEYPRVAAWAPSRALVRDRWKFVAGGAHALFDLAADPGEARNLADAQPSLAQAMATRLEALRQQTTTIAAVNASAPIPEETARRLRSLGYVATAGTVSTSDGGIDAASGMAAWTAFESALSESTAGRTAQALPVLARVAAAYPASPIFAATYARALAASGQPSAALARFRAAVTRWPTDWSLYHELAIVARDLGHADEARKAEAAALTLNPTEPSVLNGKGLLLADAEQHADAAAAFTEAVRHDPTNAVYAANLGNSRRAMGDLAAAATAYRRALEHSPALADAANGLGVILVQQQKPAEAVLLLEQAAQDPAFVEAQLNLGIALQESGQLLRAKQQYRKVMASRGPHARERNAARTLLAQLERP